MTKAATYSVSENLRDGRSVAIRALKPEERLWTRVPVMATAGIAAWPWRLRRRVLTLPEVLQS
jgi:hypothetical protein